MSLESYTAHDQIKSRDIFVPHQLEFSFSDFSFLQLVAARIFLTISVQVFNHQQLQLALLSLPSLLQKQDTVSCVIVLGINMFYHQTKVVTPGSHRAHVARLVATAEVLKLLRRFGSVFPISRSQQRSMALGCCTPSTGSLGRKRTEEIWSR